jgi:group I intron endonuclease
MKKINSGVYQIRNIVNNKRYIGSTICIHDRWREHQRALKENRHHSLPLQRAWNKHGENFFVFEILEIVLQGLLSKSEFKAPLLAREQYHKDLYKSYNRKFGYDICKIAGSCLGITRSKETRRKMGLAKIGNKNGLGYRHSEEAKQKMRIVKMGVLRAKDVKQKISETMINNETCVGKNNPMYGKHHSEESKRKNSEWHMGRYHSEETKKKMSESHKKRRLIACQENIS